MSEETKKKFRHSGVPFGSTTDPESIRKFAEELSRAMNELTDAGYEVQLHANHPGGLVVFGYLAVPSESPFARLAKEIAEEGGGTVTRISARSAELLGRFSRVLDGDASAEVLRAAAQKQAPLLTRGFSAEELATAARELDTAVAEHQKACRTSACECAWSRAITAVADAIRASAQQQLQ